MLWVGVGVDGEDTLNVYNGRLGKLKIQPNPQAMHIVRQQLNISQFTFSQTMAIPLNTGAMHVTGSQ